MSNGSVSVAKVAQVLNLKNFTPDINLKKCKIISSDVNRPALQLTGYFEHFEESRIQMIGNVEYTFIQQMSDAEKKTRYDAFLKFDIPCVIFCRSPHPVLDNQGAAALFRWRESDIESVSRKYGGIAAHETIIRI